MTNLPALPFMHSGRAANCVCKKLDPTSPRCPNCNHVLTGVMLPEAIMTEIQEEMVCVVCGTKIRSEQEIAREKEIKLEVHPAGQKASAKF